MTPELKAFILESLRHLREAGTNIPDGEALRPWLKDQLANRKPEIVGILQAAIRERIPHQA